MYEKIKGRYLELTDAGASHTRACNIIAGEIEYSPEGIMYAANVMGLRKKNE